jgi:hypothetical protein
VISLNIKNPEAHELASELARLTGESMTTAVTEAIRERLEREKRERIKAKLVADLLSVARRQRSTLGETPLRSRSPCTMSTDYRADGDRQLGRHRNPQG